MISANIPEMVCHQASLVLMALVSGSQVYSLFLLNHSYFGKITRSKNILFEHVEILQSQGKYFATQVAKSRG